MEGESHRESNFSALANELIEQIFKSIWLSHKDICHLSQTCHRFYGIANSREVWRVKASQRWTSWKYQPHIGSDWKDIFRRRLKCGEELMKKINYIIEKSYKKDCLEKKDLKAFGEYCDDRDEEDMRQVENTFHAILKSNRFKMLTLKFYTKKINVYTNQHQLVKKWCKFLCKPEDSQPLIEGAMLVAQWCGQLRSFSEEEVESKIDDILSKVKERAFASESDCATGKPGRDYVVLEAIQHVLFKDIGFHGNRRSYYDVNNSFMDKVLEVRTGIPITLSIVFATIAEKFGIRLEPVNFPMHFLLRYTPGNSSNFKYIDAFNGGKIMEELDCIQILPYESRNTVPRTALFPTATAKQVFIRMVANIINTHRSSTNIDGRSIDKLRSALELMMLLHPDDEEHRLMLSRIYLHHGVNLDEVIENLRQLSSSTRGTMQTGLLTSLLDYAIQKQSDESERNPVSKYRSDQENSDVSYYIGMVMHHRRYHYFCVIYGWDNFCHMEESWRIQMGVYNLNHGANQPFYNVLAGDGSCRYASQENLVPLSKNTSTGRPIAHHDVGKYFDEYDGMRYIPNKMLSRLYPEDGQIPRDFLPPNPYERMNENEPIDEA